MPLVDFLAPGENIRYKSPVPVEYQGDVYDFYITDKRLIWYRRKGLIFKKDNIVTEVIEAIKGIKFSEKGLIRKKGFIKIHTGDRTLEFSGPLSAIRQIYTEMQAYMLKD
jgi:hypothetical protein